MVGNRNIDVDSDYYGLLVLGIELSCESLGKHHRSHLLFYLYLIGLPTYPSAYDKFLVVVGLVLNVLTVWYAWRWV